MPFKNYKKQFLFDRKCFFAIFSLVFHALPVLGGGGRGGGVIDLALAWDSALREKFNSIFQQFFTSFDKIGILGEGGGGGGGGV